MNEVVLCSTARSAKDHAKVLHVRYMGLIRYLFLNGYLHSKLSQ